MKGLNMEKFTFTANNMETSLELSPAEGVASTRWATDDSFWEAANASQEDNLRTIVSYFAKVTGKTPREVAEQMLQQQFTFGAYSAEGLANFISKVSETVEVTEAEGAAASLALCEFAEDWLKELKDQLMAQGLAADTQYIQELDAALWGLDLSKGMFKSKVA